MSTESGVSDGELVRRLPDDAAALEELFRRHRRTVTAYAARRCSQPADVADLVAATFLAVLETGGGYDPARGAFRPWLIGVAARQLAGLRRREYRQWAVSRAVKGRRALDGDANARIEEQIDAARAGAEVERAMGGLAARHREVLWLVGYDELSPSEAAGVLGVSAGVLRVRLWRARQALRHALLDPTPTHVSQSDASQEVPR